MNRTINYLKSKLKRSLLSMDYLPRWMVFFMDVFLTIFTSQISYFIVKSLGAQFYDTLSVPARYGIVVLVYILFFFVFRTYSGIIRHSTFIDGVKLLYSTLCTFLTLIAINLSYFIIFGKFIYLLPSLFINFTC